MAYATLQDLVERFGERELVQLTDRTNKPASTIDPVPVERALEDAQAEVDSFVGKIHALPIAAVPAILKRRTAEIAFYHLKGSAADKESAAYLTYRDALAWLQKLADGKVRIEVGGIAPPSVGNGGVQFSASERHFSRNSLRGL